MVFDLEKGSTLYIDLAKSNSRSKRIRGGMLELECVFPYRVVFTMVCSSNLSDEIVIPQSDDENQGSEKRLKGSMAFLRNDDPGEILHYWNLANKFNHFLFWSRPFPIFEHCPISLPMFSTSVRLLPVNLPVTVSLF